jgi:flavodoxin
MKTLIVYYSHSANNAALAEEIQRRLDCAIYRIEEKNKRTRFTILLDRIFNRTPALKEHPIRMDQYARFIFVAPVWTSGIATPLKTFLLQEQEHINLYSFITVCGGRPGQLEKITEELTRYIGQEPEKVSELWLSDLIPEEKKDDVKYMMDYKLSPQDFEHFAVQLDEFVEFHQPVEVH